MVTVGKRRAVVTVVGERDGDDDGVKSDNFTERERVIIQIIYY